MKPASKAPASGRSSGPLAVVLAGLCLPACDGPTRVTGGGIETETFTVAGVLRRPDGRPAYGARVSVRPAWHLQGARTFPGPAVRDTLADSAGAFRITGVPMGEYAVEAGDGDSLGLFRRVEGDLGTVQAGGTLGAWGRARGVLVLEGADSAVAFHAQAYGVSRRVRVGSDGAYALKLAAGTYVLRLSTDSSRYAAVEVDTVVVAAGGETLLPAIRAADLLPRRPVPVLFENNLYTGLGDATALAALHALADNGEVDILAMATNSSSPWSGPALDAINTYYGRAGLPVGIRRGQTPPAPGATLPPGSYPYAENLAREFPHDAVNDSLPEAVELYRQVLEKQPDSSVLIVSVGVLSNLYDLMTLHRDLVARKVKELVILGGAYPSGKDKNFPSSLGGGGLPNATAGVVDGWPTPMTFVGPEAGLGVATGACLEETPLENPVRKAAELTLGNPGKAFESLDPLPLLYAARGLKPYFTAVTTGSNQVNADGSNTWLETPDKAQAYLVRSMAASGLASELDKLICH